MYTWEIVGVQGDNYFTSAVWCILPVKHWKCGAMPSLWDDPLVNWLYKEKLDTLN